MSRIRRASLGRCPRCAFPIAEHTLTCENCGAFVPAGEVAATGALDRLSSVVMGRSFASLELSQLALLLAWIPLVIGPPVAALVIVGLKVGQDRSRLRLREWRDPALIAALNIVLSLLIWSYAAQEIAGLARAGVSAAGVLFLEARPAPAPRGLAI
ncbi:hypothetical protein MKI84_07625 [Ancylobacter sp. A5.8]|uniref:hypothetical protein n=1 Tax=Ancylobacter gelatini TaxID=2919920 RepID=UPI001F4E4F6A|nr:hypothetical protein [Ancylobacter gelatini]MCJ8142785.1 hypothetical protein [Ancylobacter gelatini]